jgi:hypothetical protein
MGGIGDLLYERSGILLDRSDLEPSHPVIIEELTELLLFMM